MISRTVKFHAVIFSLVLFTSAQPSAVEVFKKLQQQQETARNSANHPETVRLALEMQALLNDAPDAVLETAEAYASAGNKDHALATLEQFAELGQVDEGILHGDDKTFAVFQQDSRLQSIRKHFAETQTPISRAETAFVLADPGLLAEDIDYETSSQSFFISSVLQSKIIRVAPGGIARDFARSPNNWPILALKVDAARKVVWATEVALNDFVFTPKSDWGRSAAVCFDLQTGKLLHRIEGPASSALGDMVLSADGTPLLSDGDGGGLYQVRGDHLERIDAGDFISPQTSARHPDGKHIFVPDYVRGIGVLDMLTGNVFWMNHGLPTKFALSGIDGLYFNQGSLIATQNGTSPERVIRFRLSNDFANVVSEEILERATPSLDPTHGVIVGDYFYYITNSGWSELDDHGNLKPGSKLTPARIMRFHL
jgi:hypothetical protein